MNARDAILTKIRQQIGGDANITKRRAAVANRLMKAPVGIIPKRGQINNRQRLALFIDKAEAVQTTVARVKSYSDIAEAVANYLRSRNLPQEIRMGKDERLAKSGWPKTPNLSLNFGRSIGDDLVGLSHADCGIAETGTLLLSSGEDNPTTLNFLPENHIIILNADNVEGSYEAAFARVRKNYGKGKMPRTVNLITGPSRSGDIEQTILLGAHGPRSLHLIVVGG
ncbi:MAG: lactate utilization protein [Rhizobiaceae bacterium]